MKKTLLLTVLIASLFTLVGCPRTRPSEYVTPPAPSSHLGATRNIALVPLTPGVATSDGITLGSVAPGADGNLLIASGGVWTSAAGGGSGAVNLWSPAAIGATSGASWSNGDKTAGRIIAVNNQPVTITGIKIWAAWASGARTIKARVCTCTNATCTAQTSITTDTASLLGAGELDTIALSSPPTLAPQVNPYTISVYDTTATSYPFLPCPNNLGQGGACGTPSAFGVFATPMLPWHADSAGHEVWMGWDFYTAGDDCPTTSFNTGAPLADEFYVVEPVIQ